MEIDALVRTKERVIGQAGFDNIEKLLKDFTRGFDDLTPVQQRNLIERVIQEVRVLPGSKLEIRIYGEPPIGGGRKKSTDSELNGRDDRI